MSTVKEGIVVTAVRTATGNLKLITWGISRDGTRIDRMGDSGDRGMVKEIAIAHVTAVRTDSGRLRLASSADLWRGTYHERPCLRTGPGGLSRAIGLAANSRALQLAPSGHH
jgi:hypothetical protein